MAEETQQTVEEGVSDAARATADAARVTEAAVEAAVSLEDETAHAAVAALATARERQEQMMDQGQVAVDQAAERARAAMDRGVKTFDEINSFARGNVDALAAMGKAATQGFEAVAQQAADFSRRSFEATGAALRSLAAAKSPNELLQLQNDFAKSQFDSIVSEFSKLSETMIKVMGDIMQPLSSRAAVTTDRLKASLQI